MMELRNEDPASFTSFLRMPPDMIDELLDRVGPRINQDAYTVQGVPRARPEAFPERTPSLHLGTSMPQ